MNDNDSDVRNIFGALSFDRDDAELEAERKQREILLRTPVDLSRQRVEVEAPQKIQSCPVCGENSKTREKIAEHIFRELQMFGSFSPGGLESFWHRFENELCSSCRADINSIPETIQRALRLLEEAVELSYHNNTARENLANLKKMF